MDFGKHPRNTFQDESTSTQSEDLLTISVDSTILEPVTGSIHSQIKKSCDSSSVTLWNIYLVIVGQYLLTCSYGCFLKKAGGNFVLERELHTRD
jgi:hypothetical protein